MSSKGLGAVIIFVFALLFLPNWILSFPEIRQEITKQTATAVDANVTLDSVSWNWFPLPHMGFVNFTASGKQFSLVSQVFEVYPDWTGMLVGKLGIGGIELQDFNFLLISAPRKKKVTRPPINWIKVTNGTFRVSPALNLKFLPLKNKQPYLKGVYGRIDIDGYEMEGRVRGKSSFASQVSVEFSYNLLDMDFSLDSRIDHLDIARFYYEDVSTLSQFPDEGFLDVYLNAKGRAMEYLQGSLHASSACLISRNGKSDTAFSCGSLNLGFSYRPDDLALDITNVEFAQPRMRLHGKMRLTAGRRRKHLLIDLKGRDIDVGQVRRSVLKLFGGDEITKKVCNIVRGGRAKNLSFYYSDAPRFLDCLDHMLIKGNVEQVPVYVPDHDLFIKAVSGAMKIDKGVLYLDDAEVKLRDSRGSNGAFVLGISDHCHELKLSVALDADLRDVKWALKKFVDDKALNRELKEIRDIRGRASGRLIMGDDLRHFDTSVHVNSVHGDLFYKRFKWPVKITAGSVDYKHDMLKWKGLSGKAGKHRITRFTGALSLNKRSSLSVEDFSGTIDASSFLDLWNQYPILLEVRDELALDAKGAFRIKRLKGKVYLDDLNAVRYAFFVEPAALELETNLLPGILQVKSGHFYLDNRQLRSRKCRINMAGSEFYAVLNLMHRKFHDWQGTMKFTGGVNDKIASWVEGHNWVPDEYFPKAPLYLKNFKIDLAGHGHEHVSGVMTWKRPAADVALDMDISENLLDIKKIGVDAGGTRGYFRLLLDEGRKKRFVLGWNGEITASVLDGCLRENKLLRGRLSGDIFLDYRAEPGRGFVSTRGNIQATDFFWSWGVSSPFLLKTLDLNINGNKVALKTNFQLFEDLISASGNLTLLKNLVMTYLDLHGDKLSDASLRFLIDEGIDTAPPVTVKVVSQPEVKAAALSEMKKDGPGSSAQNGSSWNLDTRGKVSVDFDTVELDLGSCLETLKKDSRPSLVEVEGVNGFGLLSLGKFSDIEIFGDSLCGLNLQVSVKADEKGGEYRSLVLNTKKEKEILFEDFLPCLGIKKKFITGPFSMRMSLASTDRILSGKGSLKIRASNGKIKRYGLLSRILGVVNLVDLFSLEPGIGLIEGGFPYDEITVNSTIDRGIIHLDEAVIKGRGLNLYGTGSVDMQEKNLDLIVFVSPLKTVDKIINYVPVIGAIITGKHKSLITVPVKVSGLWSDPEVKSLPVKAVTDVFKKLLFNIIKAPFTVFSGSESEFAPENEGR